MSSLTIAYDPRRPQPGYLKNLASAAAALLSALLAVPQRKPKITVEDRSSLFRVANQYELRFIASRG